MTAMPDLLQLAMRSLPHGPEFRFVDRLLSLTPGQGRRGRIPRSRRRILPARPSARRTDLPGVLLVEAGAQVAGMVAQEDPANPSLPRLKLTALRGVKIFGSARPGETLIIEATITGRLGLMVQAKVSASVSGVKVMTAELTLSGTAAPAPLEVESSLSIEKTGAAASRQSAANRDENSNGGLLAKSRYAPFYRRNDVRSLILKIRNPQTGHPQNHWQWADLAGQKRPCQRR